MDKAQPLLMNKDLYIPRVELKEFTRDNGLRVILSKNDRIPSVAVNCTYHVGSKDEEDGQSGMAHLFEHLLFEGTANTKSGEFDTLLQDRGGESNAYTSTDVTSYYMVVPSNQLEFALWLDSDRMVGFGIDQKSLDIQKDVVIEEKMTVYDNSPYGSLEEESSRRLFPGSRYEKMIIGNPDDIKAVSIDDVRKFWEKYYHPANAVLSITGDIDYGRAEELVRKYYGEFAGKEKPAKHPFSVIETPGPQIVEIYDEVQLPASFIFYALPKMGSVENYAMKMISSILGDGGSSRLYRNLITKNIASEVDTSVYEMEDVSMFSILAYGYAGAGTKQMEDEIDCVIDELAEGKFTDEEFTKVKNKIETTFSSRRHSIIGLADKLSSLKTFYGDAELINTEINYYLNTTRDDLVDAAHKYLDRSKRLTLNYLPNNNS
jgi:zinc protease